jgi:hypothetical protein
MSLTHYFIPGINLFSDLKHLSSGMLWNGIEESREEMFKFTIQQYENLLENLPQDLLELKNEAKPGRVVIRIPPLAPLEPR